MDYSNLRKLPHLPPIEPYCCASVSDIGYVLRVYNAEEIYGNLRDSRFRFDNICKAWTREFKYWPEAWLTIETFKALLYIDTYKKG